MIVINYRFLLQGKDLETKLKTFGGEKERKMFQTIPMVPCNYKTPFLIHQAFCFKVILFSILSNQSHLTCLLSPEGTLLAP